MSNLHATDRTKSREELSSSPVCQTKMEHRATLELVTPVLENETGILSTLSHQGGPWEVTIGVSIGDGVH